MAGNNGGDRLIIEKLEGTSNWATWKFQMKHLLLSRDLWKYIDGSETLDEGANADAITKYRANSQKALTTIVLAVSTQQIYLITSCTTPEAAWKALSDHFECSSLGNKLILKKAVFPGRNARRDVDGKPSETYEGSR